ncbi:MAG: T9SS type A sorting domain-containing protein [Prolixibacteraceae bacterium]
MKNIISVGILFTCWLLLSGWGYKGHEIIGKNSALSFNDEMGQFESWVTILANHSGDADKRKSWDKSEGIKHYIDIDNFPEFNTDGKISQNMDTLILKHGRDFLLDQGILPWATLRAYDTLVSYFESKNFDGAALIAADLSHYVADGHMPLHITANYDGQLSGNDGIHSRYESTMINAHQNDLNYEGGEIVRIENVADYVFSYIYNSNRFVDSILQADNYAKKVSPSITSAAYTDTLWQSTRKLTILQFEKASFSLAELIYTAWLTAGSPSFDDHTFSKELSEYESILNSVYYRDSMLTVEFGLNASTQIVCEVFNLNGEKLAGREIGYFEKGQQQFTLNLNLPDGIYLLSIESNRSKESQKFFVR